MTKPFQIITDDAEDQPQPSKTDHVESLGMQALMMGLSALSQRTIVALSRLFVLAATASAFALWWAVLPNPTVLQLVGLGMYGIFVLAASFIARRL